MHYPTAALALVATLLPSALAQITLAPRQVDPEAAAAACSTAGAILIGCESATPGYDGLSPQSQASCACSPGATVFDNSINTCLAFLSAQPALAATYSTALPFASLCARNGGGGGAASATTTGSSASSASSASSSSASSASASSASSASSTSSKASAASGSSSSSLSTTSKASSTATSASTAAASSSTSTAGAFRQGAPYVVAVAFPAMLGML